MIDLLCWDFGDTLADERWMRLPHPACPEWAIHYDGVLTADPAWTRAWEEGRVTVDELVERLRARIGLPAPSIAAHLAATCRSLRFFPSVLATVEALRGQVLQACVTVNPDVFTTYVVPAYELEQLFDVIVTSWETGQMDKSALARQAREALGLPDGLGSTLLVDNKAANVEEFRAAGGRAHHFRGGEDLRRLVGL